MKTLTEKKARVIIIDTIILDINNAIDELKRQHKTYEFSPLSPITILEQKRWDLCTERRALNLEISQAGQSGHTEPEENCEGCRGK